MHVLVPLSNKTLLATPMLLTHSLPYSCSSDEFDSSTTAVVHPAETRSQNCICSMENFLSLRLPKTVCTFHAVPSQASPWDKLASSSKQSRHYPPR